MSVLDLCKKRYSVRNFTGETVAEDILQYILQAGRWASTSRNRQARRFVVLDEPDEIAAVVRNASMQEFVSDAGVLIFGVATDRESSGALADVVISMTQMEMAAVEQGLGSIWLGIWDADVVRDELLIPQDHRVVVALALGYPVGQGSPRDKLPTSELYRFSTFPNKTEVKND